MNDHTEEEALLERPDVPELANIPLYDGPNLPGLVNSLVHAAQRIAKGAVTDGLSLVHALSDERRGGTMRLDMPRDVRLELRLTTEEHSAWLAAAKTAGLPLSEFIRRRVNGPVTLSEPPAPVVPASRARAQRRKASAKAFGEALKKGGRK